MTMRRTDLIEALRGHTTKHELDGLTELPTAEIRAALAYALSSTNEQYDRTPEIADRRVMIGIDLGLPGAERMVFVI